MSQKACSKCKVVKSFLDFARNKDTKTGFDYKCKQCHLESWHARKPSAKADWHVIIGTFIPSQESFGKLLENGSDGLLRWKVEFAPTARKVQVAGTFEGTRQRITIQGQRYNGSDIIVMMETGQWPEKQECDKWLKFYEAEWMKEVKVARFPDWSSIHKREWRLKTARDKWHCLSIEEKKKRESSRCKKGRRMYRSKWKANRRIIDPSFRIKESLSTRLATILKAIRQRKASTTMKTVGCSLAQLKQWIEANFAKGMTWDNYGTYWHVDHVLPASSFNHSDPNQVRLCWHWTNLKPLEAIENMRKGAKITQPQMNLLLPC